MRISVIIPFLNEENQLKETILSVLKESGESEIIAVDGGSTDNSRSIVEGFEQVQLIEAAKGRSLQMNGGAALASGEVLLFLHADTKLPVNGWKKIEEVMQQQAVVGGSFYLKFDHPHWLLKLYSRISRINHPLFTYGDHAIFIRRSVFEEVNGYKPIPFMEDIEIQQRLRKRGKFRKLKMGVTTSSRRFIEAGIGKQMATDILLVCLYHLGVSPTWMKRFYRDNLTNT
jgi:rSAM/selenodomain-associated transferase 2